MTTLTMRSPHLLTGEELTQDEMHGLIDLARRLREERRAGRFRTDLAGKHLAMLFEKPSLRTRFSFAVAMHELGGEVIESTSASRKSEEPEDLAGVLTGYVHGVMIRTHEHGYLDRFSAKSGVPVINGLSDSHHPCQALADLLTLAQRFDNAQGLELAYIGDGNNVLHSLLLVLPAVGISVRYACPKGYEPDAMIVKRAKGRAKEGGARIAACASPKEAAKGADALYTDVWASMGQEAQQAEREKAFRGYQLSDGLIAVASARAVIMHCMPMVRGQEISNSAADHERSVIFQQAENRLHIQKAILLGLLGNAGKN